jgi:condensin complex subunit 3
VYYCCQNHNARDKAVRFRVCQLINRLFTSLGDDAAIDDELYESVYTSMQCRLRDKFPIVRVHAVLALARLQDPSDPECPIVAGKISALAPYQ